EPRVIVEAAAEAARKAHALGIDAVGGEKTGALLEQVEGGSERSRHAGVAGERAQAGGRVIRIAFDGEKTLDQGAHVLRQPGGGAERCLFEKAVGNFADRAAADGG